MEERKEKTKNPQSDEEPSDDHQQAVLELFHVSGSLLLYDLALKIKYTGPFPEISLSKTEMDRETLHIEGFFTETSFRLKI